LRENDYVLGPRKMGGNAQSIIKNRWVHHTSFLWDFDVLKMRYLKVCVASKIVIIHYVVVSFLLTLLSSFIFDTLY